MTILCFYFHFHLQTVGRHATMICCYYPIKLMNSIRVKKPWQHRHHCLRSNGSSAMQIFAQKFHILMCTAKRIQHRAVRRMSMDFSALVWATCWAERISIAMTRRNTKNNSSSNDAAHRTVSNRHAISSIISPNFMANRSDHLAYQKPTECQITMRTSWRNVKSYCTNIAYDRTSSADIERQWSKCWKLSVRLCNCMTYDNVFHFLLLLFSFWIVLVNRPKWTPNQRHGLVHGWKVI